MAKEIRDSSIRFQRLGGSKKCVIFNVLYQIFSLIIFILFAFYIFQLLLGFDVNKRAYNHRPGKCRQLEGIKYGAEDISLVERLDIAFISSGLTYMFPRSSEAEGNIFLFDYNKTDEAPLKLEIEGMKEREKFSPHGMTFSDEGGIVTLYVISHIQPKFEHTVEVFVFDEEEKKLIHKRTIKDEKFVRFVGKRIELLESLRPNNIVSVGHDKFIISNDGAAQSPLASLLEMMVFYKGGSLVYFDGKDSHWLQTSIVPNGVVLDREKKHLIVSHVNDRTIGVYELAEDFSSIVPVSRFDLKTIPDNLYVDEKGGIWLAAHPVAKEAAAHLQNCDNLEIHSPSQILLLNFSSDWKSVEITEVLADEGKLLSASAVAVQYKNKLLAGSVCREAIICDNPM